MHLLDDPADLRLHELHTVVREHLDEVGPTAGFTLASFDVALMPGRLPPAEQEDILQTIFDAI